MEPFTEPASFISYITKLNRSGSASKAAASIIVVGSHNTTVIPLIHDLSIIQEINVIDASFLSKELQYAKVSVVVPNEAEFIKIWKQRIICDYCLEVNQRECIVLPQHLPDNFMTLRKHVTKLDDHQMQSFWFILLTKLLCETSFSDDSSTDPGENENSQDFSFLTTEHQKENPIRLITPQSPVFRILQKALLSNSIRDLFLCRMYLSHLYQWCQKQPNEPSEWFELAHKCSLSKVDFEDLQANAGRLVITRAFLIISEQSITNGTDKLDERVSVDIVFDQDASEFPFYQLEESFENYKQYVCFPGTPFRVIYADECSQSTVNTRIKLQFGGTEKRDLLKLMSEFENLLGGKIDFDSLGKYLCRVGKWKETAEYYTSLSSHTSLQLTSAINSYIGYYYTMTKDYKKSLMYYERCLHDKTFIVTDMEDRSNYEVKTFADSDVNAESTINILSPIIECTSIGDFYNNIGFIYMKFNAISTDSIQYFEKAKTFSENRVLSYISACLNLSCAYFELGEYSKSLSECQHALELSLINLPPKDSIIDACLNNITIIVRKQN